MLKKLLLVLTLNRLLDEASTGLTGLRSLGWSRLGLSFERYLSYCVKASDFALLFAPSSDCLKAGLSGANLDDESVRKVLAETSEPEEKVRPWQVTAVEADCALEVYRLSAGDGVRATAMPRASALL